MSTRRSILLILLVFAAGAAAFAVWRASSNAMDPANATQVARGRAVYDRHCARCHGAELEGEPDWRTRKPSGELPAPPHDATGHTWHHPDEQLFAITKHGMARFAPADYKSAMPAFVGTLSDADIRAVIAYIKSTWPEDIRRRHDGLGTN